MKNNSKLIFVFILFFLLILAGLEFFKVETIKIKKVPDYLYPDGNSMMTIVVEPVNRFGTVVPFKRLYVKFEITEGFEKVEIVEITANKLVLKSRYEQGFVIIRIKNFYTIVPIEIKIQIKGMLT